VPVKRRAIRLGNAEKQRARQPVAGGMAAGWSGKRERDEGDDAEDDDQNGVQGDSEDRQLPERGFPPERQPSGLANTLPGRVRAKAVKVNRYAAKQRARSGREAWKAARQVPGPGPGEHLAAGVFEGRLPEGALN